MHLTSDVAATTWIEVMRADQLRARVRTGGGKSVGHILRGSDAMGALGMVALEFAEAGSDGVRWSPPGLELVTVMLHGALSYTDSGGGRALIGPEDVAALATGAGVHREEHVHRDGMRALLIWMFAPAAAARSAFTMRTVPRQRRLGALVPVACNEDLGVQVIQLASHLTISTGVLSVGTLATLQARRGRGYLMSTLGRVAVGGVIAEPGDRVILRGTSPVRLHAIESTEVVLVDA